MRVCVPVWVRVKTRLPDDAEEGGHAPSPAHVGKELQPPTVPGLVKALHIGLGLGLGLEELGVGLGLGEQY